MRNGRRRAVRAHGQPASLPPEGLPGLDPNWSRLVGVEDATGVIRTFHVLDSGSPPDELGTVVCVHGNPTWSYLWRRLVDAPPRRWRVVAVDQLGMGYSQRIPDARRLAERVDDLDRLIAALDITGPIVTVAHDWGGPISLGFALAHRDRLRGVVLTNTAVHQPPGASAPTLIRMARAPGVLGGVCRRSPTFVRATTAVSRPRMPAIIRDAYAAPYETADRRAAVADFVADIPLEPDHVSAHTLDDIAAGAVALDVPVLLAWGPSDPVFSDVYLRDLISRIPHADVHRYVGASHLVTEDAPRAIDDIRRWIEALAPDGRLPASATRTGESPALPDASAPIAGTRRPMWAALLERAGSDFSDQAAVVELRGGRRSITWAHLDAVVRDLAAGLHASGVRGGDRVALLVPPGADLTAAVYACWRIGAVVVVADAGLGLRGLARALRGAWPDHVIAIGRGIAAARLLRVGGHKHSVDALGRRIGAEDTLRDLMLRGRGQPLPSEPESEAEAVVVFTSGATGPAKGVVYRHAAIEANRDALSVLYDVTTDDRLVAAFAPFALYGPALGITSVVPDMDVTHPSTLTSRALADAVRVVGATMVWAAPAALRNVVATAGSDGVDSRMNGVRLLMSAGAPVPTDTLTRVLDLMPGAVAHTPYGMTEVLPVTDIDLVDRLAAGTGNGVCVGAPVAGVRLRVAPLDAEGRGTGTPTESAGITGEVHVAAPWSKDRYDRLWATESASTAVPGWHRTGDVGHLDTEGRLWLEGRLQHVITTADGPVTPVGVEMRVEALAEVGAAACVGVGPIGAQVVVVVVVPRVRPPTRSAAPSIRSRWVRGNLADPDLTTRVREAVSNEVAAVLVRRDLPTDVRHNSKVDRTVLGFWAETVLG